VATIALNDIPYAEDVSFTSKPGCLHGTRGEILADIHSLLNGTIRDHRRRVVLLTGTAGTGKSAIARTIAEHFHEQKRLGSSFFFDRLDDGKNHPNNVFSTIACDIADLDPRIREKLCDVVKDNRRLRKNQSPREQFNYLILSPTKELNTVGPIIVVLDAMDECGDEESRKEFLDVLAKETRQLPDNFRFLLTARPDTDIEHAMGSLDFVHHIRIENVDAKSTTMDVRAFIQNELSEVSQKPNQRWPDDHSLDALAELSDELFIWASTACRFIRGDGESRGRSPDERMNLLLSGNSRKLQRIDDLYLKVLRSAFNQDDPVVMNRFRSVMGAILVAKVPLSAMALNDLFESDVDVRTGTEWVVPSLGSLLRVTFARDAPLRILHLSFSDFLTNYSRSEGFFINLKEHTEKFAISCLSMMNQHLKRDICAVGTPLLSNAEITNIQDQITKWEALHYACRFFAAHLIDIPTTTESALDRVLVAFLHTILWILAMFHTQSVLHQICNYPLQHICYMVGTRNQMNLLHGQVCKFLHHHLLHWIESLSLTKELDSAVGSLESLEKWLKVFIQCIILSVALI
jgi:AAA ATPase domain